MHLLKCLNVTIIVPQKRILLRRQLGGARPSQMWSCTVEEFLQNHEETLPTTRKMINDLFRIVPSLKDDRNVSITRLHPVTSITGRFIIPVLVQSRVHMSFPAHPKDEFYAVNFDELLDDIMAHSIYPQPGYFTKHTPTCVHVARAMHERRIFG